MSLPIDIPRRAPRSALTLSSVSSASSSRITTPSSSPGLYIPIHKRTASSESPHGLNPAVPSRAYSADFLLSLRPTADESVRGKLRTSCPEVLISRRIRKNLEFHDRQRLHHDHLDVGIHRVPALPSQKQLHVPSVLTSPPHSPQPRVLPRRNSRAIIRPVERRRQARQPIKGSTSASVGTWRGFEGSPRQSQTV